MSNKSNMKLMVTRLKNKIINQLHELEVSKIVEIAKMLNIRVNPELLDKVKKDEDEQN